MKIFSITYGHEFISQSIRDELILYRVKEYKSIEQKILQDVEGTFGFNPGTKRDIQTLSGGQRVICYLITLSYIIKDRGITDLLIDTTGLLESLTLENREKLETFLQVRSVNVK